MYLRVNPELKPPERNLLEFDRIIISRYITGSHMFNIEAGRLSCPKVLWENGLCKCQLEVQSLHHVLFSCPLWHTLHNEFSFTNIEDSFKRENIHVFFAKMEKLLLFDNFCRRTLRTPSVQHIHYEISLVNSFFRRKVSSLHVNFSQSNIVLQSAHFRILFIFALI